MIARGRTAAAAFCFALVLLTQPGLAYADDIESGRYVGLFGIYRMDTMPAEMVVSKGGRRFKGVVTFTHFEHAVDTTLTRSSFSFEGEFDKRSGSMSFTFLKWTSPAPDGDYLIKTRRGTLDPAKQLMSGDGFEFAREGTQEAQRLARLQTTFERRAVKSREASDEYKKRSGQYSIEKREVQLRGAPSGKKPLIEWPMLGLQVAVHEVTFARATRAIPVVVGVRNEGPAFFSGVQPGDVIIFLKCGAWQYNFYERESNYGGEHVPSFESVGKAAPEDMNMLSAAERCKEGMTTLMSVAKPKDEAPMSGQFIELSAGANGNGWLADRGAMGKSVEDSTKQVATRYQELRRKALSELRVKPCSYDVSNPYDRKAMPPIVQQLSELQLQLSGGKAEEPVTYWRDVIVAFCDEEKNGRLPAFEAAMIQISRGELDACAYDSTRDYSDRQVNVDRLQVPHSRLEYDIDVGFEYYLAKIATPPQRKCLFDILRANLQGKPYRGPTAAAR